MLVKVLHMHFLVGDDAHRKAADARVSAENRLAIFGLVLFETTLVDDSSDDLLHVVRTSRIGIDYAQKLFFGNSRSLRLDTAEGSSRTLAHFSD